MNKTLLFKCNHCDKFFSYPEDGADVKGIHAVQGTWIWENKEENLIANFPEIDSIQTVMIGGKFRIDLNKEFWIYYVEPLTHWNGLDTLEGINSIRFCKCSLIAIQSSSDTNATLTVSVKEVLSLEDLSARSEFESVLPDWWKTLLKDASNNGQLLDFDNYFLLIINIQSDLGLTMVIKKGISESQILMVHDWDFHTNAFYGTNIRIKNSELEKFRERK